MSSDKQRAAIRGVLSFDPFTQPSGNGGTVDFPDLGALKSGFDLLRSAIGLVRDAKDLQHDDARQQTITQTLDQAERAAKLAEAQVAKALGYHLCQCTFPPQIMLSVGRHPNGSELFQCPYCKKQEPPGKYFGQVQAISE